MSWAELQAEARARAANLLGVEHLGVLVWPAGEPSYVRIRRWERALAAAVNHFDNLLTALKLPARLRRLVTALCNQYGRQLALARDGCDSLTALVILEPGAACMPPPGPAAPGSSTAAGRCVCEVVVPPVPSAWAGLRPRSPCPSAPPSPSSPKKKRKTDPSPSPDLSPPPPPCRRKGLKRAPVDEDGVPVKYSPPAPRRAPQAGSLLLDDVPEGMISIPSGGLAELLRRAVRDGAADALAGVAQQDAPRSALRPPGRYRVRFGSTAGVAAPPEGPPTEPPSTPGSRRGGQEEEEEPGQAGGPAGDMDVD
ncbi:hypothetical protein AURDEDRAFT_173911 [Auricularia subglabra TFB-10046 SS5]|nr:hypothetical protein AURDEDRAFT_173911 [Auricularia subglabra TFB-10046 SS5]